ncbi:cell division protein FtsI, partial [Cereibacter changlensis JA139]
EGHNYGPFLSATDVIVKSSNVGVAHIALQIGGLRQQAFLKSLGFFDATPVELIEAPGAKPLIPARWADITTITTSYGHGMSASPLHLAAAYSAIANGGIAVKPTLLRQDGPRPAERVMRKEVALSAVSMLRQVVTRGTASYGDVPG